MSEEKVTMKLLYETLDNIKNEQKDLRHEQNNKFQTIITTMEEKFEKRFDKLESMIERGFTKAEDMFATKIEHKYNSERISKIEGVIGKIAWIIIMWVLGIAWASIFVVIMLFWDKF